MDAVEKCPRCGAGMHDCETGDPGCLHCDECDYAPGPKRPGFEGDDVVPVEVHEHGWQWRPTATDTAFAPPFGTIRQCRVCGCLVAGGPTACARCAEAGA